MCPGSTPFCRQGFGSGRRVTVRYISLCSTHPAYSLMVQIGKALAARKMLEMIQQAQMILPGIHEGKALKKSLSRLQQFLKGMNLDTDIFSSRRKIAEHLYQYKRYPF